MNAHFSRWVVVPMKDIRRAKSRLQGARVTGVIVVCERDEDAKYLALSGVTPHVRAGVTLNEAVLAGAAVAEDLGSATGIASLPGDLPYLLSSELESALSRADRWPRACLADSHGTGTTLLTATRGTRLEPAYGHASLARHRAAGAVDLAIPLTSGLRRDVDQRDDLRIAASLGLRTRRHVERRADHVAVGGLV